MATFTPPTYDTPAVPNTEEYRWHVRRHYKGVPAAYSVLITSGVVTPYPGRAGPTAGEIAAADDGSGEGGKAWFRGGIEYTVTDAEGLLLDAAGYTIVGGGGTLGGFSSGFSAGFAV